MLIPLDQLHKIQPVPKNPMGSAVCTLHVQAEIGYDVKENHND